MSRGRLAVEPVAAWSKRRRAADVHSGSVEMAVVPNSWGCPTTKRKELENVMFNRMNQARQMRQGGREHEGGFTLIELLVVIAILGILAAIVVFSVAGVTDKGQLSACKIDTQTLRTAEEANFAQFTKYDTMANVMKNGFLSTTSTLHDVVLNPPGAATPTYSIVEANANNTCGTNGDYVGPPPGTTNPPNSAPCTSGTISGTGPTGWGDC